MKKHSDQELIILKQKQFLLAMPPHRKPKFNKISWIKENVKTMGVYHGYNVNVSISFLNLSGMPFISISNPEYDIKRFFTIIALPL
jgi:hypothetical protein